MTHRAKQILFLLCISLLPAWQVLAQLKCKVEYYSTEQGLSHGTVSEILRDQEGFMWFGTWDGINRFDGRSFTSFKTTEGEMAQKGDYRIAQVVEDQQGYLWIRTYYDQVYRFDKRTKNFLPVLSVIATGPNHKIYIDSIVSIKNGRVWLQSKKTGLYCLRQDDLSPGHTSRFSSDQVGEQHLSSNLITVFHEDQHHRIWIGTPDGLHCLAQSPSGSYKKIRIVPFDFESKKVTAVDEDEKAVYFSTTDGSLLVYNKKSLAFSMQKLSDRRINALFRSRRDNLLYATSANGKVISFDIATGKISQAGYRNESLGAIYEDRQGILWIEPQDSGVVRFNPSRSSFSFFSQKIKDPKSVLGNRFNIFEDINGTVWVNMKGGGFGYYNASHSMMEYTLDAVNMSGFHLPRAVYKSYYDSTGVLWLRIHGGELVKIIFQEDNFKQQLLVERGAELVDNEVRGILCDNKNRLWLASKSGKLHLRQDDKWIQDFFENEPRGGLGNIYVIFQDSRENIWLGTKGNGLFKATAVDGKGTKYRLKQFRAGEANSANLSSNYIYSVIEDKSGRIWIGTFENGLVMADDSGDSTRFICTGNTFRNYPRDGYKRIRHMALDRSGNIWIGATDGLLVLNPDNNHSSAYTYRSYPKVPDNNTGKGSSDIQFIYSDAKSRMWLATSGGGICLATGDPFGQLQFKNYTTADGLPNDYVLSCIGDKKGNLWIATEHGLSKFNPENNSFRNYDSYDGLPRAGFSEAAACRELANGNLVFGTANGYLMFDPEHASMKPISANIVFTSLQVNKENAWLSDNAELAGIDINYTQAITLDYDENIIEIDYAILDPRAGTRQAIAYRLLGFDSTWHTDRKLKGAVYTNLPPGQYVFEVRNLYTDLYAGNLYKRLEITILPPPWKTAWAYAGYLVAILLVLALIRHYALKMVRLRNKIVVEQKLAALKLNFFTGVSHELRTPLTLIINPLQALARKEKLSGESKTYVEMAQKNADRMLRFVNQLLDLRKAQSENATLKIARIEIVGFVRKVCEHFTEAARSKQLHLSIVPDQAEHFACVDPEKLDVIIYNLLSNAIKFTPEGKSIRVFIKANESDQCFSIAIHDQGPGVQANELEKIFELFHEGDHSANNPTKGSGIGLALSKEFAILHGGSIQAFNNEDGGLTVTVKIKQEPEVISTPLLSPTPSSTTLPVALNGQPSAAETMETTASGDTPLLLLVEDNNDLRQFLKDQLSEFYRVEVARDGAEGWQKAKNLLPDLVVSDIMMPEMDGIQLLAKLKSDLQTSHIPLVLLSAKHSIESRLEGLNYGADCYITKPFNNEFLLASINNLLRQRQKLFEVLVQKKTLVSLSTEPIITSKDESFIKNAILAVEDKMADPEFRIETIAEVMTMGQKTFYRKIKSLTGLTPAEFVRDIRLQRARQLLDAGGNNVSDVAYLVGFTSPKYFSTCFKEKYHLSPSDCIKSKPVQPISVERPD